MFSTRSVRKTSVAEKYEINHEFVDNERNNSKKAKKIQQNH